jgi:hypothetical protein
MKSRCRVKKKGESGYVFIMVLLTLLLGVMVLVPTLSVAAVSMRSIKYYTEEQKILYAADSYTCDVAWAKIQRGCN